MLRLIRGFYRIALMLGGGFIVGILAAVACAATIFRWKRRPGWLGAPRAAGAHLVVKTEASEPLRRSPRKARMRGSRHRRWQRGATSLAMALAAERTPGCGWPKHRVKPPL